YLLTRNVGEILEKFVNGIAAFEVIDQVLNRNPRAAKQGAPLMISGSILTTDLLTRLNVGQGETTARSSAEPFDKLRAGSSAATTTDDNASRALSLHAVERFLE